MNMTPEEAVLYLRQDPKYAQKLLNAYLGTNIHACGKQFARSAEFEEVRNLVGAIKDTHILDLGSGTGIAAYAFSRHGARCVYALEPDPSEVVGYHAIHRLTIGMPVRIIAGYGEAIPLPDATVDIVYARQVLHHTRDLDKTIEECARVLKLGGVFLACREHVVDDEAQRDIFLRKHVMHNLTGNENAFPLSTYLQAISKAGLVTKKVLGPWDTVINIYPAIQTTEALRTYPQTLLKKRYGKLGVWMGKFILIQNLVWKRLKQPTPGRMYAFLAMKTQTYFTVPRK
ncbi:MAG: class I SAM-dependent methyltransferase [Anaerolineae bacterium]|nr:class I SAM-dependent methyltransferase [Anaerolineae bacterium]